MILADFECPDHGPFETLADADAETLACPDCGEPSAWLPTPVHGRVRIGEVERGKVARPDSPMFLDTRELGEGMPLKEFKEKRRKLYEERRWKESKEW
jgi:hypothetical protein